MTTGEGLLIVGAVGLVGFAFYKTRIAPAAPTTKPPVGSNIGGVIGGTFGGAVGGRIGNAIGGEVKPIATGFYQGDKKILGAPLTLISGHPEDAARQFGSGAKQVIVAPISAGYNAIKSLF